MRQDHYDAVVSALVEKTKLLKKGNPLQPDTFVGPLITESDAVRIEGWVNDAVAKGGQVLAGGKRYGQVYDATIVARCDHKCDLWVEEAFAPVVVVEPYSDFKAAVGAVNASKFGIHAGVFTTDLNKSIYAWENMDVGGVVIGDVPSMRVDAQVCAPSRVRAFPSAARLPACAPSRLLRAFLPVRLPVSRARACGDAQPYGGVKDSGIGREGIRYAIEDMTEMRVLLLKNVGVLP